LGDGYGTIGREKPEEKGRSKRRKEKFRWKGNKEPPGVANFLRQAFCWPLIHPDGVISIKKKNRDYSSVEFQTVEVYKCLGHTSPAKDETGDGLGGKIQILITQGVGVDCDSEIRKSE